MMINRIPEALEYAWLILRYSEDFNGTLSDEDCIRKIADEIGSVNILSFVLRKGEMMKMTEKDLSELKEVLNFCGLF